MSSNIIAQELQFFANVFNVFMPSDLRDSLYADSAKLPICPHVGGPSPGKMLIGPPHETAYSHFVGNGRPFLPLIAISDGNLVHYRLALISKPLLTNYSRNAKMFLNFVLIGFVRLSKRSTLHKYLLFLSGYSVLVRRAQTN